HKKQGSPSPASLLGPGFGEVSDGEARKRIVDVTMNGVVDLGSEVDAGQRAGHPIVALESTIIAHGMPWPQNAETALAVEAAVRALGAVPATIAILDGRLKVGLGDDEIEQLGRRGRELAKVSRRDVPILVARGGSGATTVAATMMIAALANIRVFATGGIGGV